MNAPVSGENCPTRSANRPPRCSTTITTIAAPIQATVLMIFHATEMDIHTSLKILDLRSPFPFQVPQAYTRTRRRRNGVEQRRIKPFFLFLLPLSQVRFWGSYTSLPTVLCRSSVIAEKYTYTSWKP